MKTTILSLLCLLGTSAAFASEGERHIALQADIADAEFIRVDIPAGDVEITGISGNKLTAEVTATCQNEGREDCYTLLKQLDWTKKTGRRFELGLTPGITHYNHVTMKIKVGVPRDKPLDASLSAGELRINDTSACLVAEVNAGEITMNLNASQLASAELSAKVGDVTLTNPKGETVSGERSLLVGANLEWKGSGNCQTKAKVLTGEAKLVLK